MAEGSHTALLLLGRATAVELFACEDYRELLNHGVVARISERAYIGGRTPASRLALAARPCSATAVDHFARYTACYSVVKCAQEASFAAVELHHFRGCNLEGRKLFHRLHGW